MSSTMAASKLGKKAIIAPMTPMNEAWIPFSNSCMISPSITWKGRG
jgi:hypothetical protein